MPNLYYGHEYTAFPDAMAERIALDLKTQDVYTSTGLVLEALRLLIVKQEILPQNVSIVFQGKIYSLDQDGMIIEGWPEGLADYNEKIARQIILTHAQRYKKNGS